MDNKSPSRRRREGREAYRRHETNPLDACPYSNFHDRRDWVEGWRQAKDEDEARQVEEARAEQEHEERLQEFALMYNEAKERGLI